MGQYNSLQEGWERQESNPRLQGFNLALQPSQLHSQKAEAKRIERLTVYFIRRRFQDAFLVRAGQPPCLARTEGIEPSLYGYAALRERFRRPMCLSSYTTFSEAESSGVEPQLFIHLFSKQRRSPDRFTLHNVGRSGRSRTCNARSGCFTDSCPR